jgi:cytochrome bd-type quinol oxidase subunit 1
MLKFHELIRSRKFWALIASVVAIAGAVHTDTMPAAEAANMLVAALAAYSVATGIEDSGRM